MRPEDHDLVRQLFHSLAELSKERRQQLLQERNAPAEVIAELESLFRHEEKPDPFGPDRLEALADLLEEELGLDDRGRRHLLDTLVTEAPDRADAPSGLPTAAEAQRRYELRDTVAEGGMGTILRVWDRPLRRDVAMKVVSGTGSSNDAPKSPPPSSSFVRRFIEEARITGQLDHPGVVPVHELALNEQGEVFFTMRLVKGITFKEVIERVASRRDGWTQTRALHTILRVCETMAFAHARGVIHRDLKPANIMVGSFGETYVMDWGLGKVLAQPEDHAEQPATVDPVRVEKDSDDGDARIFTLSGEILGTPPYMPPEQASGEMTQVGPQADVYAVGAVLYHLLAGYPPYTPPGTRVSAHTLLARLLDGPPQPLSNRATRNHSEELVAICEKAMSRQVNGRYPDMGAMAEDVRAYLEQRVVKAHRTGAVVEFRKWVQRNRSIAASLAAVLILLLTGATWVAVVESEKARVEADRARIEFDKNVALARERDASNAVVDHLVSLYQLPRDLYSPNPTARELLVHGITRFRAQEFQGDAQHRARLLHAMGQSLFGVGAVDEAEEALKEAWDLYRDHLGADHETTLEAALSLTVLLNHLTRFDESERITAESLRLGLERHGERSRVVFHAMTRLAHLRTHQGEYQQALALYDDAVQRFSGLLHDDDPIWIGTLGKRGEALQKLGRLEEAEAAFQDCVDGFRRLHGDSHDQTLIAMSNLGGLYLLQQRFSEAADLAAEIHEQHLATLGNEHPYTLTAAVNLANLLRVQGRPEEALKLHLIARQDSERALGATHPVTISAKVGLARALDAQGDPQRALPLLREVLDLYKATVGDDNPKTIATEGGLGTVLIKLGRLDEAEEIFRRLLPRLETRLGENNEESLQMRAHIAFVTWRLNRTEEGLRFYKDARKRSVEALGPGHRVTLSLQEDCAALFHHLGRSDDALDLLRDSFTTACEELGEHFLTLKILNQLTTLHFEIRQFDRAEEDLLDCLNLCVDAFGDQGVVTLQAYESLAMVWMNLGRYEEALDCMQASLEGTPEGADRVRRIGLHQQIEDRARLDEDS